jgi:hypothetical protein
LANLRGSMFYVERGAKRGALQTLECMMLPLSVLMRAHLPLSSEVFKTYELHGTLLVLNRLGDSLVVAIDYTSTYARIQS